ncbi:MAG TPA: GNAT family N-acetyltransferase [Actinomycetota bacterium]
MGESFRIRPLDPERDRPLLGRLWEAALGSVWPLPPGALDLVKEGLVAERGAGGRHRGSGPGDADRADREVGVVAVDPAGSIPLLVVDPAYQRRGVGTRLLEAGMARLGQFGATTVALGSGGSDYIWPGVPDNLPGAVEFFRARGWGFDHTVIDLVADLRGYEAPAGVGERAGRAGVSIEVMAGPERAEVMAFEAATFPDWVGWFERLDSSVLVARDRAGAVAGTLLFRGPLGATIYEPLLGPDAGTIGCVGVAAPARGAGVGSAMVARASELLRDAGTRACHIGWTRRERFYTRLGYAPWRRYHMARRMAPG